MLAANNSTGTVEQHAREAPPLDADRFDDLTVAIGTDRRAVVRGVLAGAVAAMLGRQGIAEAGPTPCGAPGESCKKGCRLLLPSLQKETRQAEGPLQGVRRGGDPCDAERVCLGNGSCAITCHDADPCPAGCACLDGDTARFLCIDTDTICSRLGTCATDEGCPAGYRCQRTGCPGYGDPFPVVCVPLCAG